MHTLADDDETLEVLVNIKADKRGNIVCQFVDASGSRILLRFNPQAAHDLHDELTDLLSLGEGVA